MEDMLERGMDSPDENRKTDGESAARDDAIQALTALGYSATEATTAVRKVNATPDMTVEDILKQSLKNL